MTFIAILRGINVGGKRKIRMEELRQMLNDLGLRDVRTYIQSGNVVFESEDVADKFELSRLIQDALATQYGYDVPVQVLSASELKRALSDNPFYQRDPENIDQYHLTFLDRVPDREQIEAVQVMNEGDDQFEIDGRFVFIRCFGKYHKSKLSNQFFEKKLGVNATTRNWKTVRKLGEMAGV